MQVSNPDRYPPQERASEGIRVAGLEVRYGERAAVHDLSFEVESGRIVALLGPNGAGKSSTVRCLIGLQEPSAGTATIQGIDVAKDPERAKRKLAYVPEHGSLYEVLTPMETLLLAGRLHGLEDDVCIARGEHLLAELGLLDRAHAPVAGFSKGMRQKLVLACAILTDPDVLVLDEPLSGLDAETTLLVKELLLAWRARGAAILYCSHMLDVVEKLADRILILDQGRLVADGTLEELRSGADSSLDEIFRDITKASDPKARAQRLLDAGKVS
ncbi:MAG TPA: ABC transporter ATP-binding protein [Planctomycetota bacterium]|nr:ABC transporter ATP-binding protein [Planctomycetota bacterium]